MQDKIKRDEPSQLSFLKTKLEQLKTNFRIERILRNNQPIDNKNYLEGTGVSLPNKNKLLNQDKERAEKVMKALKENFSRESISSFFQNGEGVSGEDSDRNIANFIDKFTAPSPGLGDSYHSSRKNKQAFNDGDYKQLLEKLVQQSKAGEGS